MNVLMSGARGLLGSEITPRLKKNGHQVRRLVRSAKDAAASDFVAVVHESPPLQRFQTTVRRNLGFAACVFSKVPFILPCRIKGCSPRLRP